MSLRDELKPLEDSLRQYVGQQRQINALAQQEPKWKRAVRTTFTVFFMLVWLNAAAAAYCFISTYNRHTDQIQPDAIHTQPLTSHGRTVYITPSEKARVTLFMRGFFIGIPSAFIVAIALELSGIGAFEPRAAKAMRRKSSGTC